MDPLGTLVTLSLSRRKSVALSVQGYLAHKKTLSLYQAAEVMGPMGTLVTLSLSHPLMLRDSLTLSLSHYLTLSLTITLSR